MSDTIPSVDSAKPLAHRLRLAGLLLVSGLLIEGATLFALERPLGFLAFATVGGLLILAGIVVFLWTIVSQEREAR